MFRSGSERRARLDQGLEMFRSGSERLARLGQGLDMFGSGPERRARLEQGLDMFGSGPERSRVWSRGWICSGRELNARASGSGLDRNFADGFLAAGAVQAQGE